MKTELPLTWGGVRMNPQIKTHFRELKITGQRGTLSLEEKKQKDLELIEYL